MNTCSYGGLAARWTGRGVVEVTGRKTDLAKWGHEAYRDRTVGAGGMG